LSPFLSPRRPIIATSYSGERSAWYRARFQCCTITLRAIASGVDPAMQWRVAVDGEPCPFLIFGHLVGGEREFECDSHIKVDTQSKRFSLQPGPDSLWGQRYPGAVYHLVTSTPEALDAIGADELLYADEQTRNGPIWRCAHGRCASFVSLSPDQ
jgi:1,2-beta-oligoglucan phosphorylase